VSTGPQNSRRNRPETALTLRRTPQPPLTRPPVPMSSSVTFAQLLYSEEHHCWCLAHLRARAPSTDRLSASSGTGLPGDNFGSNLAAPKSSPTATDPSPRSHKLVGEVIRLSRRSEERSDNLWPHRLARLSNGQTLGSLHTPRSAKENLRLAAKLVEPSADALLVSKVYSSTNDPSMGFFPLRRFKHGQRQTSGLPHPTLLRLQVFSTS